MSRKTLQLVLWLVLLGMTACGSKDASKGGGDAPAPCTATFTVSTEDLAGADSVFVIGDFNGWNPDSYALEKNDAMGRFQGSFAIGPGRYAYRFLTGEDAELLDEANPLTIFGRDGREHSLLIQRDCNAPYGELEMKSLENGVLTAWLETAYRRKVALELSATLDGAAVDFQHEWVDDSTVEITLAAPETVGPHRLEVVMKDSQDNENTAVLVFHHDDTIFRWEDAVLYQIVTDRFLHGAGEVVDDSRPITHRMGGDYEGIEHAITSGYFEALGVNALWISPAYENAAGEWEGFDGRKYESYHGYWPIAPRKVDARWGGEVALRSLVDTAHGRNMRMILDIVPNHTHIEHPYFVEHREEWFNHPKGDCVCGRECDWGRDIEHCWFIDYLPDLDWTNEDVLDTMIGDTVWWMDSFGFDGLRVDAVAMMPRLVTRHLRYEVERRLGKDLVRPYLIGETYTGSAGRDDIRWYLGPYGLSGQFDFPLMWSVREVVAQGLHTMDTLLDEADLSHAAWEGSGAVMGLMLGNHDVTRFLSVAAGDEGDGVENPPDQPTDAAPYRLMEVAHAFLLTQRGAVFVYYGDEIGMAGAGDPDNRRAMVFGEALNEHQQRMLENVGRLIRLRQNLHSWRYGERTDLLRKTDAIAYLLADEEDRSIVVLSRSSRALSYEIPLPDFDAQRDWYEDLEDCTGSGSAFSISEKRLHATLEPYAIMTLASKKVCHAVR